MIDPLDIILKALDALDKPDMASLAWEIRWQRKKAEDVDNQVTDQAAQDAFGPNAQG